MTTTNPNPTASPPPARKASLATRVAGVEKDRQAAEAARGYFQRQPGVARAALLFLVHRADAPPGTLSDSFEGLSRAQAPGLKRPRPGAHRLLGGTGGGGWPSATIPLPLDAQLGPP